ncbi:MAG: lytic transglycosylase domain-containing protein [Dehalococcoidia bacterium]|nr:lytic transglycosylase domain-containing protein [Dehalococcoidia bacterium]
MAYSPEVERWRPLVEKYFPPELVDKALYVIQHESGGNPGAVGDGGAARGLFQIQDNRNFPTRPDAAYLDDPENNIRFAAQQLGAANGNWGDWGEGRLFEGKPFGALGNNPYPGDGGTPTLPGSSPAERAAINKEIQGLREQYTAMLAEYQRDPNGNYTLADIQDMAALINDRQKSLDDIEATGYGRQQDAFANSIALGDYQAKQADRAWQRYLENRRSAETAAQVEIDRRAKHNLAQGDIEAARQANFGQGPQASTKTYLPANYGDLLDEYSKKFGADTPPSPPSSDPSTYGGPALPGQGGYPGGGYEEPFVPVGGDGLPISGPGGASTPTMVPKPLGNRVSDLYDNLTNIGLLSGRVDPDARRAEQGSKNTVLGRLAKGSDFWKLYGGDDRFLGMKMGQGNAPGRAVDKKIKKWWQQGRKVVGFANGTMNAPGGPARVGEKGPETMIDPRTGLPMIVGELGPEVREVPQGAAVYPTDIPPDEAFAHYQMQQMASQQNPRSVNMAEAQARASDPQLQQKVMAALQDAVVARTVSNPPATPGLAGVWTKPDPWADWRAVNDPLGQGVA